MSTVNLGDLTIDAATRLIGTSFEVALESGGSTTLRLDQALAFEVRPSRRGRAPKRTPFSLFFLSDPTIVLPQGSYDLRSDAASFEDMFLVPVGQDNEGTEYEAVFT